MKKSIVSKDGSPDKHEIVLILLTRFNQCYIVPEAKVNASGGGGQHERESGRRAGACQLERLMVQHEWDRGIGGLSDRKVRRWSLDEK